mgnify:CR=1 FL=1
MTAQLLFEVTRGNIVESAHYGSIAIVDSNGKLISSYGDPKAVAFLGKMDRHRHAKAADEQDSRID